MRVRCQYHQPCLSCSSEYGDIGLVSNGGVNVCVCHLRIQLSFTEKLYSRRNSIHGENLFIMLFSEEGMNRAPHLLFSAANEGIFGRLFRFKGVDSDLAC